MDRCLAAFLLASSIVLLYCSTKPKFDIFAAYSANKDIDSFCHQLWDHGYQCQDMLTDSHMDMLDKTIKERDKAAAMHFVTRHMLIPDTRKVMDDFICERFWNDIDNINPRSVHKIIGAYSAMYGVLFEHIHSYSIRLINIRVKKLHAYKGCDLDVIGSAFGTVQNTWMIHLSIAYDRASVALDTTMKYIGDQLSAFGVHFHKAAAKCRDFQYDILYIITEEITAKITTATLDAFKSGDKYNIFALTHDKANVVDFLYPDITPWKHMQYHQHQSLFTHNAQFGADIIRITKFSCLVPVPYVGSKLEANNQTRPVNLHSDRSRLRPLHREVSFYRMDRNGTWNTFSIAVFTPTPDLPIAPQHVIGGSKGVNYTSNRLLLRYDYSNEPHGEWQLTAHDHIYRG